MDNNSFDPRLTPESQQPVYDPSIVPQPAQQQAPATPRRRPPQQRSAAQRTNGSGNRRPGSARRRRRTKMQQFKESYLPFILIAIAVILVLVVIFTLSSNSKKRKEAAKASSIHAHQSEQAYFLQLDQEAASLILEADKKAATFDYDGAIAVLDSFSNEARFNEFQQLVDKRNEYEEAKKAMVAWSDPSKVVHFSTHHLVAEPARSFADPTYKSTIKYNFITIDEFSRILESLYENDFILVGMDDIVEKTVNADGTISYSPKTLYLPAGKKPIMITQTHNSPSYVFDNNGDGDPDCVSGFASRLVITNTGKISCEYTDRKNNENVGNYDLIPILESFIEEHPEFSYHGARATIAVTGRHFLFGYQTNPTIKDSKGTDYYEDQVAKATEVATKLKKLGYDFACYTYGNKRYGELSIADIQQDLKSWKAEVEPILGPVDTLVFAMDSDIAEPGIGYSGSKFETLTASGFSYFVGFCDSSEPWMNLYGSYVRQGRLTVFGSRLISDPGLYEDIFDAVSAKDQNRY